MSTELATIPKNPAAALATADDPAAAMVALVDQARLLLDQAKGMEGIARAFEIKSRGEAIRVYTQQKDMGHEAELSAAEIVRRAERRIGQLIREGQATGEVATEREGRVLGGKRRHQLSSDDTEQKPNATAILGEGPIRNQVLAITDRMTDEEFEQALAEAQQEGNVSRANIIRKVKPATTAERIAQAAKNNSDEPPRNLPLAARAEQIRTLAGRNFTSPQIADEVGVSADRVRDIARRAEIDIPADAVFGGKFRKKDPNRIIDAIVDNATPEATALAFVAYSELDRDRLEEWASSLSDAIRSLQTIKRNIQKELTRDQA